MPISTLSYNFAEKLWLSSMSSSHVFTNSVPTNLRNVFHEILFFYLSMWSNFFIDIKLGKWGDVTVYIDKKESKENVMKKYFRFIVTEFVKTCDELVIGSSIHFQNQQPRYCSVCLQDLAYLHV